MIAVEPRATAIIFTTLAILIGIAALSARAASRTGVPVVLVFLLVGVLAGVDGIGRIAFDDYDTAFRFGMAALVLILFDGGLNTAVDTVRLVAAPAAVLATVGVVATAGLLGVGAHAIGLGWREALLVGAIVSSTDAAAVFSVLRSSGVQLKRRVGATLEVESGINDPMAVLLTSALTTVLLAREATSGWRMVEEIALAIVVGIVAGVVVGYGGRALVRRARLPASGLYAVLTVAMALLAFGAPTLIGGSGLLAVYISGVLLGDTLLPNRPSVLRVHDALAWLGQVTMFLMLGLLATPSRLPAVAVRGVLIALVLAIVARPLVVALCLLPFRYPWRELVFIGGAGLRGAVPIVLATVPVLAGAPEASRIFDVVFIVVVVSTLISGGVVSWLARLLGLESGEPPPPQAVLEIESTVPLAGELLSYHIDDALAVCGVALADLPFPEGAAVTLIVRGRELVAPKGTTVLTEGDHVYIFSRPEDRSLIQLMFGRPEEE